MKACSSVGKTIRHVPYRSVACQLFLAAISYICYHVLIGLHTFIWNMSDCNSALWHICYCHGCRYIEVGKGSAVKRLRMWTTFHGNTSSATDKPFNKCCTNIFLSLLPCTPLYIHQKFMELILSDSQTVAVQKLPHRLNFIPLRFWFPLLLNPNQRGIRSSSIRIYASSTWRAWHRSVTCPS